MKARKKPKETNKKRKDDNYDINREIMQVVVKASGRTYKAEFNTDVSRDEVSRPLTLIGMCMLFFTLT